MRFQARRVHERGPVGSVIAGVRMGGGARAPGRHPLTPSQRAALTVEMADYALRREGARARSTGNLRRGQGTGPEGATLPPPGAVGRTRDQAATQAGVSARTIQDAQCVRDHDPALFKEVLTGRIPVATAARRVRQAQTYAGISEAPSLPTGPFGVILADPPWQMGAPTGPSAPENHYPTMPLAEIEALPVPAGPDGVLYLWAVNMLLPEALQVMDTWGFRYRTSLVWVKPSIGPGVWARQRHELVLVGTRGTTSPPAPRVRMDSVIEAPRGRHSAKPECLYERIEHAHPGLAKCELFARGTPRAGWVAWGNQLTSAEPGGAGEAS